MTNIEIIKILEDNGITVSYAPMKDVVGLVVKPEFRGISIHTIEATAVFFNTSEELDSKCKKLQSQNLYNPIVCFKPYVMKDNVIRGAFLTYHEMPTLEIQQLVQDIKAYYDF